MVIIIWRLYYKTTTTGVLTNPPSVTVSQILTPTSADVQGVRIRRKGRGAETPTVALTTIADAGDVTNSKSRQRGRKSIDIDTVHIPMINTIGKVMWLSHRKKSVNIRSVYRYIFSCVKVRLLSQRCSLLAYIVLILWFNTLFPSR